jgi:hypothetical protein
VIIPFQEPNQRQDIRRAFSLINTSAICTVSHKRLLLHEGPLHFSATVESPMDGKSRFLTLMAIEFWNANDDYIRQWPQLQKSDAALPSEIRN